MYVNFQACSAVAGSEVASHEALFGILLQPPTCRAAARSRKKSTSLPANVAFLAASASACCFS